MIEFLRKLACSLFTHDYEMEFPNKDRPFDWQFRCRRCGRVTRSFLEAIFS